ncbi:MAG: thioredoxin-disulfide reductase [Candidatus Omnitrophica bacterium]|nr:thioredoxin-disulfide reductase [Candidatus Omnitrophota bacterium]MDD5592028.1 thioredoxin-disulfide reductase [Candidatus Omnitrophota bacterium]
MYDLIIIGGGPAGLTCALYAGRFRMKTLLLEKMSLGGQVILTPTIENFPGFSGGVITDKLISSMQKQVEELDVEIKIDEAQKIIFGPESKISGREEEYRAKTVVIASGAKPKRLGVAGEERLTGRGVSYCGTCDGPLFRDKDIIVVGGGDRAIEDALFLSSYAKKVNVIHRRQALRASKILEEKARQNPKINFILDTVIEEIKGKDKAESVKLKDVKTGSTSELSTQGVFIFVGIEPNTIFLKNQLNMDEAGFIMTDQDMKASCEGVFACGDCRKKGLYQVITACAEGAQAADSAHKYLLNK